LVVKAKGREGEIKGNVRKMGVLVGKREWERRKVFVGVCLDFGVWMELLTLIK